MQGVILAETPHTLTVQTANETIPVATVDIEARKESALSMMPEGLARPAHRRRICATWSPTSPARSKCRCLPQSVDLPLPLGAGRGESGTRRVTGQTLTLTLS